MAIAEGQDWDLNLDLRRQWEILIDNKLLFTPGESQALRKAKEAAILDYPRFVIRHFIGAGMIAVGAFVGAFSTLFM